MSVGVVDRGLIFYPTRPGQAAWSRNRTGIANRIVLPKSDGILKCVNLTDFKCVLFLSLMTKLKVS